MNEQQIGDQKTAAERNATNKYIAGLNSEDEDVASSTRSQFLQTLYQNPDSPEGRVLLSQAAQALRQRSDDERGPFDGAYEGAISALPEGLGGKGGTPRFPADLTLDESSLEPGFGGQGVGGTIVKDKDGQVLGNLDDLKPEYAEAIKFVYNLKNSLRRQ